LAITLSFQKGIKAPDSLIRKPLGIPDSRPAGYALGLVRRLVEQVRGSAIIDSDHGTIWTIKIPVERIAFA